MSAIIVLVLVLVLVDALAMVLLHDAWQARHQPSASAVPRSGPDARQTGRPTPPPPGRAGG
ncbi:MAG TPA: hypothetical protein PK306_00460 [Aquabacterium sp.]|nr:hypothetical protein [Aquabacterium sp.]HQC94158.1 hypothetical protein [Aquabacterium sp.]